MQLSLTIRGFPWHIFLFFAAFSDGLYLCTQCVDLFSDVRRLLFLFLLEGTREQMLQTSLVVNRGGCGG